ncbi:MAG: hypothetical protein B9S36_04705 [Verrucomicrobiia bacterium Tous-C2TDCM]|nr:MAG: hypothetical protein B9S36_04705 [Verrucomicrobiae bacterium Tous-C2TDCM]
MNPSPGSARPHRLKAFSLTEVTMATGLIATLALPLLAMLAGSASSQGSARDRETAARIAQMLSAAMVSSSPGTFQMEPPAGDPIEIPAPKAGETVRFFSFDADGTYLGETDASAWVDGLIGAPAAVHLVRLRITSPHPQSPTLEGLCELELIVSQPAAAAASARSRDRFLSRVVSP